MAIKGALEGNYSFLIDPELALENYNNFGFHIEKDFLDASYCNLLVQEGQTLSGAMANNFKPALMIHKEKKLFLDELKNKKTVAILHKLMGGTPTGLQTQFFYCKPGTRGFSLHQDNFYVQARYDVFISVWVSLVDTHENNGGLIVYPGSHKEGQLPVRKLDLDLDPKQDKNANNEETIVPKSYQPCNLTLGKGSALFIHSHVVHGSNDNKSNDSRYSLLNLYIKEGEAFRSGNSARREPIILT